MKTWERITEFADGHVFRPKSRYRPPPPPLKKVTLPGPTQPAQPLQPQTTQAAAPPQAPPTQVPPPQAPPQFTHAQASTVPAVGRAPRVTPEPAEDQTPLEQSTNHPYNVPEIWGRVREFAPWDPEVNRKRLGWRVARLGRNAARGAASAASTTLRGAVTAPLNFAAGVGLGTYRGMDYYVENTPPPTATWGEWLHQNLGPRALGESVGMSLREVTPAATRLVGRATVATARGVGSLALQGGSAYVQGTYGLYRAGAEERERTHGRPPEFPPNYDAANALRPRLNELTLEVVSELQPGSIYIGRFRTALNSPESAIARGQVELAEVILDEIEQKLGEVVDENRRHGEATRGLPRRP